MYEIRPYQQRAIDLCVERIAKKPDARIIVQMPTGTGKTVVFSKIIEQMQRPTLIIAHREELLRQAKDKLVTTGIKEYSIDIVLQSRPNSGATIWIASIQTLVRGHRTREIKPGLIIIDEAHHSCADTYQAVLAEFPGIPVIGFTATPTRKSKKERNLFVAMWQEIIFQMGIKQAIIEKWLAPLKYYRAVTSVRLDGVHTTAGDFNPGELADKVDVPDRNRQIVEKYLELGGGKAVLFSVNLAHARNLQETFQSYGVRALYVDGGTPTEERKTTLNYFQTTPHLENTVICNCGILTEGWDCPDVKMVILARPTKSPVLYMQMVGRGTRNAPGKEAAVILDIVDNYKKPGLCNCLQTIFNLRLQTVIEGDVLGQLAVKGVGGEDDFQVPKKVNIEVELANILFDMPEEVEASSVAWYSPEDKHYYCCVDRGKYLFVEDSGLSYRLSGVNPQGSVFLLESADFKVIEAKCLELAEKYWSGNRFMWDKSRRFDWGSRKPTEKQIKALQKLAPNIDPSLISKATASEIISAHITKKRTELASQKQVRFLRMSGVEVSETLTKQEAGRQIAQIKGAATHV